MATKQFLIVLRQCDDKSLSQAGLEIVEIRFIVHESGFDIV